MPAARRPGAPGLTITQPDAASRHGSNLAFGRDHAAVIRGLWRSLAFVLLLASAGCALGPTEQEIADSLEATLRSVTGDWHGRSSGSNAIALDFHLRQGSNGEVTGTGRMKQPGTEAALPFTVSGTYRRPVLSLTFTGLRYEGGRVQGTLQGDYVSVGGISTMLQLTGPDSSSAVPILLQEE